jgi:Concanavalin A-like lectin/glucanases superfamily
VARQFNGSSDQISVGNPTAVQITGDLSSSIWLYLASGFSSGFNSCIGKWDNSSGRTYLIGLDGNDNYAFFAIGQLNNGFASSANSTQNVSYFVGGWHHLAGTFKASTGEGIVYVDGIASGTVSSGYSGVGGGNQNFIIGNQSGGGSPFFNGKLAEGALWNAVLSPNEIASLASGSLPYQIRPLSLAGYWPLYGVASPEPDLSGNGNNGTLTGTTYTNHPPVQPFQLLNANFPLLSFSPPPPPPPVASPPSAIPLVAVLPAIPGSLGFLERYFESYISVSPPLVPPAVSPPSQIPLVAIQQPIPFSLGFLEQYFEPILSIQGPIAPPIVSPPSQIPLVAITPATLPGSIGFLQHNYEPVYSIQGPIAPPVVSPPSQVPLVAIIPDIPGSFGFLQRNYEPVYSIAPPVVPPPPTNTFSVPLVALEGPPIPGTFGFLQRFFEPIVSIQFVPPPPPPPPATTGGLPLVAITPNIPGSLGFMQRHTEYLPVQPGLNTGSNIPQMPIVAYGPQLPGSIWFALRNQSDSNRGQPGPGPSPPPPTPPIGPTAATLPLLPRQPDLPPRQRRWTEQMTSITNSLIRSGQIQQLSAEEWAIVLNEVAYYAGVGPNWANTPPASVAAALDRLAAAVTKLSGGPIP